MYVQIQIKYTIKNNFQSKKSSHLYLIILARICEKGRKRGRKGGLAEEKRLILDAVDAIFCGSSPVEVDTSQPHHPYTLTHSILLSIPNA